MNTKWSPAVERALHEVGDTAPLAPAFDSLPWAQPTPAAPRGRRAGTFAAAALALAAAAALVVVVLPSGDDGPGGIVGTSVPAQREGEAARLAEICAMDTDAEDPRFAAVEVREEYQDHLRSLLDNLRQRDEGSGMVDRFVQECTAPMLRMAQLQALRDLVEATAAEQSRRALPVTLSNDIVELSFAEMGSPPRGLHATVFRIGWQATPLGYLTMDQPGEVGTYVPRSDDGNQFADGVNTGETDRYSTAGLAPGRYLVCARVTVPYGLDVCGTVHIPEP